MKDKLFKGVKTKADVLKFVSCIDSVIANKYKEGVISVPPECSEFKQLVENYSVPELADLRKKIIEHDTFVVRLPFKPSHEFEAALHSLFEKHSREGKKDFILEFIQDKKMPFGAVFSTEGIYTEVFLKDKIFNYLGKKDAI